MAVTRVLMVCLGNICRSPLAEGILQHKATIHGLDIEVDSAGTAAYHVGEQPDPRSQEIAKKNGIDISQQRARQFKKGDFDEFDMIYAMDISNYNDILFLADDDQHKSKVKPILNESFPDKNLGIPDPYYGGQEGFEDVFKLLSNAADVIIKNIEKR